VRSLSVKEKEKTTMKQFVRVLLNISVANTSTYLLWSAFSFWIYLETRSVLVLSVLSGTYILLVTLSSMFFGTIVDKHKKKRVIAGASVVTMALLLMASAIFFSLPFPKSILYTTLACITDRSISGEPSGRSA
jgi:MFS family permease